MSGYRGSTLTFKRIVGSEHLASTDSVQNGSITPPEESSTPWVVQKFGGTSLGKFPESVANIIKSYALDLKVAVVCSARSSHTKNDGTTSRLLRAAKLAERLPDPDVKEDVLSIVQSIQNDHLEAGRTYIHSPELRQRHENFVDAECQSLVEILESDHSTKEASLQVENKIISKGEKLACQYLALLLEDRGVPSHYIDLSDIVERQNISTNFFGNQMYKVLADAFRHDVLASGNGVPVITGYFGNVGPGLLHTVGRGYSDLAAALVAIALSAGEMQIYKEVDGIFSADPRKVPTASLLSSISPSEAAELTYFGSEVIHPHTMEQVIQAKIPIRIKNVMNPDGGGTVILPDFGGNAKAKMLKSRLTLSCGQSSADLNGIQVPKRPTAVTVKRSVTLLNCCSNKTTRAHGFLSRIFQILDTHHLSVDLIASSEVHVTLALHSERPMVSGTCKSDISGEDRLSIDDERLELACNEMQELGSVEVVTRMAIISLVGQGLKNMIGISGKFLGVLGDHNINIEMISQGASEINISCVILEKDADRALNVVHTNLFTFLE